jgi:Predicted ATPase
LHYAAVLHQARREAYFAQERAEATITLAREHGFVYLLGGGMCIRGWALAEQGEVDEGLEQLLQGIATWRAMGAELAQTHMLGRLAETYGKGNQAEKGLDVLAEALEAVQSHAERYYEAELYRHKGELLLQQITWQGDKIEVEACFRRALSIARDQCAKSLELRAVLNLSRLWQEGDKRAEARRLLAETYGWFTEGFETADLQEAQGLLEALA